MRPRVLIFANPIAGRGRGQVVALNIQRDLAEAGFVTSVFLDRPADIPAADIDFTAEAAVCIGGDGTLRGVVNKLHGDRVAKLYEARVEGPPLLPVQMGTANLMGRHLNLVWPRTQLGRAVVETIQRRNIVRLDAGRANGRLFMLVAGVGIDGQIVHLLDRARRGPIDMASYLLPAAMTFANYDFPPITVTVDQQVVMKNTPAVAFVGNVREYGIGFPILIDAVANDGLLDFCVMPCRNRLDLVELLLAVALGEHSTRENAVYVRGTTAHIDALKPVAVQVDGDAGGFTPLDISILPGWVPFLVN